jgi:hypothetical protein
MKEIKSNALKIMRDKPGIAAMFIGMVHFVLLYTGFLIVSYNMYSEAPLVRIFKNLGRSGEVLLHVAIYFFVLLNFPGFLFLLLVPREWFGDVSTRVGMGLVIFISSIFWSLLVYGIHRVTLSKRLTKKGKKGTE